jgi:hypothetical protein
MKLLAEEDKKDKKIQQKKEVKCARHRTRMHSHHGTTWFVFI